jgi:hypothetical protein
MQRYNPQSKERILAAIAIIAILAGGFLLPWGRGSTGQERRPWSGNDNNIARLESGVSNRLSNGGWKYDAYPNLESLDAGKTITIASIKGPAQINTIHITADLRENEKLARSVVLEIFFDDAQPPAVSVPLGDFFADGTGRATYFTTPFVEKTPDAYNCYIPMPFKKSARVTLRNDSHRDIASYSYVEWQTLPDWDASLGYFHTSWRRLVFQLTPDTTESVISLTGPGHLIGEYWNINTDEPEFAGMNFVMEGNNEFRVDGEKEPSLNYLGSEDSFNFSWGWHQLFNGYKVGINHLSFRLVQSKVVLDNEDKEGKVSRLSTYRFRDRDAIHFVDRLRLTIDWTREFRTPEWVKAFGNWGPEELERIRQRDRKGGGWVDYGIAAYWYSSDPKGPGLAMPPIESRLKPVLHPNPSL